MRIVWIDPLNTNPHYLNLMAVVLRDVGHDVQVCSVVRDRFPAPGGVHWEPFAQLEPPVLALKNRPRAVVRLVAGYPFHWRRAVRFAHARGVRAVVVSTNLALRRTDAWAMGALQRSGLATVVVVHKPWQTFRSDGKAKPAHKAFYRRARRVLAMDDQTRAFLQGACEVPGDRLRHLPHPHLGPILSSVQASPELARRLARWKSSPGGSPPPVVAFLSQMREEHGFPDLLAALPSIGGEFPDWRLLVVSSNVAAGQRAMVERRLAQQGLRNRCWLHWDPYSTAELKAFLDAASLVATPYTWAGRSMVIGAAIGAGVPVVATDVGGLGMGIRPGVDGELAPPGRPRELGAAIAKVLRGLPRYRRGAGEPDDEFAPASAAEALTSALDEVARAG